MKLQTLAAACAAFATVAAAGAAFASEPVTVKLQQPVAESAKFIAGGAVFTCQADTCVSTATTSQTFATATCKTIAAKVGPVAEFTGRKALDAARLADCNASAVAKAASGPQIAKQ